VVGKQNGGRTTDRTSSLRGARISPRLGGLLAYGLALLVGFYGASLASDAYHKVCEKEATWVATDPLQAVGFALIMVVVVILPTLLARSKALVKVNLCLGSLTTVFAFLLLFTAGTSPDECYSSGGSYEDHVSGLPEFTFCFIFLVVISYVFVLLDWSIWAARNLAYARNHR
jgi:hypothetical protein